MPQLSVSDTAFGKVNLYFAVGPVRADGYHEVASLYAAVNLRERVTVSTASRAGIALSLSLEAGSTLACLADAGDFDPALVPLDERNLAYRAAELVLAEVGKKPAEVCLDLHIEKSVPVAGGMAGGSADAAAALKAMSRYAVAIGWVEEEISPKRLLELGSALGADVPFCLMGGLAVGYGAGQELIPVETLAVAEPLCLDFVLSRRGLSTPAVFRELDDGRAAGRYPQPEGKLRVPQELIDRLSTGGASHIDRIAELVRNDLEAPALALAPELQGTLDEAVPGAVRGFVSGSGPTVAFLVADQGQVREEQQPNRVSCSVVYQREL